MYELEIVVNFSMFFMVKFLILDLYKASKSQIWAVVLTDF